jgi:integrase
VDLARGAIRLEHTKNRERRALPLAGPALELMKARRAAHAKAGAEALVFPAAPPPPRPGSRAPKGPKPVDLRYAWRRALAAAGVSDFRFHDLRHSAASYLAMNGASLAEIAAVLGHKTLAMVKRYAHLSDPHTADVVTRMNRAVFGEDAP